MSQNESFRVAGSPHVSQPSGFAALVSRWLTSMGSPAHARDASYELVLVLGKSVLNATESRGVDQNQPTRRVGGSFGFIIHLWSYY